MRDSTERRLSAECGDEVDPDEAHWCHEDGCTGRPCGCDVLVHPECCAEPDCAEVAS